MDPYSPLLAVALACGVTATITAIVARRSTAHVWRVVVVVTSAAGAGVLTVAIVAHVAHGHRPGSAGALGPLQFLVMHPAAGIAALLVMLPAASLLVATQHKR